MKNVKFISCVFILTFFIATGCEQQSVDQKNVNTNNSQTVNKESKLDSLSHVPVKADRITPEVLWQFGREFDAQLSPDGKNVVYCVKRYNAENNKGYTDIFVISTSGGDAVQLTKFAGPEVNPRWSASGDKIFFLAAESGSMQIWKMNTDGSDQKQVSEVDGDINSFEISPDGKHFLFTMDVKVDETPNEMYPDLPFANVRIFDDMMPRHWDHWHDYKYSHIFVANYDGSKLLDEKDIMQGEQWDAPLSPWFDNTEMVWSTDGNYIAYTCKKFYGKEYSLSTNSDIYLYNVATGATKNMTEGMPGYDKYPVFSPDATKMTFISMKTPGYESDKERLFVMDIKTGEKTNLSEDFDQNVSNVVWIDNENLYCISGIHATFQIYKVNVANKQFKQITKGWHDYTGIDYQSGVLIGEKMSMSMATEIFAVNEEGVETQLTLTNKSIYDKVKLGKVEERWVKTTDNKDMLVWVIYPPDFDSTKTYPALLYCQGGPQSAVSQFFSFRWNFQIMAANDYIIVAPNRRGLPTFGQEWNAQISGDYGGQNMKDYFSAINTIKKEPYIDENRLGAVGASYGGFSVYWLAGHNNGLFKAFIAHCGMFNLESQYAATDEFFFVNHDLGGPYWDKNNEVAQRSYANSPHHFIKNWDAPILIITGEHDFRIPYTESLQAFQAAKLNGVDARLMIFPEESHFVLQPQNAILWQREFFRFLDEHLK